MCACAASSDVFCQARAHKLRHVSLCILVCQRARHFARNAIHQHQDGDGRLLVTVSVPNDKQKVQLQCSPWRTRHQVTSMTAAQTVLATATVPLVDPMQPVIGLSFRSSAIECQPRCSSRLGDDAPREATHIWDTNFRNGRCSGSCCVTSSSVGSLGLLFTRGARRSIGSSGSCFFVSCSAGNKASVSATGIDDTSSGEI